MSEFNITQWCDFVRGVGDPEKAEQMRDHLEAGSTAARSIVEAMRSGADVGRSDSESPVPLDAVRIAKAIGGTSRANAAPTVRRIPCLLAFDSLLEAAPAGSRNLQQSHRELTFTARGYSVDLRLEQEIEPPNMVMVGQLLRQRDEYASAAREIRPSREGHTDRDNAPQPVSRAPVLVYSGERLIGKAVTGIHGEFQVEGLPRESLDLCVVAGEDFLELPLATEPGLGDKSQEDAS